MSRSHQFVRGTQAGRRILARRHQGAIIGSCGAFIFLLLAFAGRLAAQPCSDIARVDFRNSTIKPRQIGGILDSELKFRNGVFDEMEEPGGSLVAWHFEIVRATIVRPSPHTTIRFIEISGNHLTGTGSRNYLIGFRCSNGAIENVFQQNGEGMQVVSLLPLSLELRFFILKESDPHCCPSQQKDVWFSWDAASATYVKKKETIHFLETR